MSRIDPLPPDLFQKMNLLARKLDRKFRPRGFALLVFDFGPDGRMNYISNAAREDMLIAMKEFIAKNEGRSPDQSGTA